MTISAADTWLGANSEARDRNLALLVGDAIRREHLEQFRQAARQIALNCSDSEAKAIFRLVRQDLPEIMLAWLDWAVLQIQGGSQQ